MMTTTSKNGALGLLSGGLDSQLAVRLLQRQGITVRTIVFNNPFYDISAAVKAAAALEVPLRIYDFTDAILALIKNPPHGFGKCMNPCIDCHALMLRRAGDLLAEEGCRFLFTGEVLNERPMSQTRRALQTVAADSAYADLVLRPLSALSLPPVKPEREGWVDRQQLLNLNGRRRTTQFALAREFGLQSYPSPAGGCLLTEPNFCSRLRELQAHEGLGNRRHVERLRAGRHFRLPSGGKFILGRDEADNHRIADMLTADDYAIVVPDGGNGPTGMLEVADGEQALREAAAIFACYVKCPSQATTAVEIRRDGQFLKRLQIAPLPPEQLQNCRIGRPP